MRKILLERLEDRQLLATFTWDGGGGDNLWTTPANWVGDAAPLGDGTDDLVFAGTARTANVNNFPIGTTFNSFSFNNTAGNFIIDGHAIVLNGGIDIDVASGEQTFNLPMVVNVNTTFNVSAGSLTLGGALGGTGEVSKTGSGSLAFGSLASVPTVSTSGGDVAFSSITPGTGAYTFTFAGAGPTGSIVPTSNGLLPNLARIAGAIPFSASEIGVAPHSTADLNDGLYGNSSSWIGGGTPLAGIDLPGSTIYSVSAITFGRANDGGFADRSNGIYTLYHTLVPDPNHTLLITGNPTTGWASMGTVVVDGTPLRKTYAVTQGGAPIAMTGLMFSTPGGAAIDEIEIYGTTFGAPIVPNVNVSGSGTLNIPSSTVVGQINVTGNGSVVNLARPATSTSGGFNIVNTSTGPMGNPVPTSDGILANVALTTYGSTAFASSVFVGAPAHRISHLNDGLYGNSNSWLGTTVPISYAGIDLAGTQPFNVRSVAFGRTNIGGCCNDRSNGTYTFYRTLVPNPNNSLPITGNAATGWEEMGTVTVTDNIIKKTYAVTQNGTSVLMTGLMIGSPAQNAIDEIEMYGEAAPTGVPNLPTTTVNVSASSTLSMGTALGTASLGTINVTGSGTVLNLQGAPRVGSGAFAISQLSTGPAVPGGTPVPTMDGSLANLALASVGGLPFASGSVYPPTHTIAGLNNGLYGNAQSWIGSEGSATFAGVDLPGGQVYSVSRIAFGRNSDSTTTPVWADRSDGTYTFYRTLVSNPSSALSITGDANTGWEAMGTVTVAGNSIRKTYSVTQGGAPVTMTGFMMGVPPGVAVDEIEIFGTAAVSGPINLPNTVVNVSASSTINLGKTFGNAALAAINITGAGTTLNLQGPPVGAGTGPVAINLTSSGPAVPGGTPVPTNNGVLNNIARASAGAIPFASQVSYPPTHSIAGLNNGLYGNSNSWIGAEGNATFAGINLPGDSVYSVSSIAFGRNNDSTTTPIYSDRSDGTYTFYRTLIPNPSHLLPITGNATTGWEAMGTVTVSGNAIKKTYSVSQDGLPISMTGFMMGVPAGNCIDEIEIYGEVAIPGPINLPNTAVNVSASSTLDLGVASAAHRLGVLTINASAGGTNFTLQNANNITFTGIVGAGAAAATGSVSGSPVLHIAPAGTINVAAGVDLTINSQIGGTTTVHKIGAGRLLLANTANTYTGETIFGGGIINVASVSDYGIPSSIGARTFAMENTSVTGIGLHFQGGTLQYTGSTPQSTNRQIRVINGATGSTIDASGSNANATLSFTHSGANINLFDTPGARTINLVGTNTGNNVFAIQVTNQGANQTSLRKAGSGTWFLTNNSNTYTGETIFAGGILNVSSVADYGVASAIGARTLAEENNTVTGISLHFQGGTLQYTGSTPQSTNRQIRVLNGVNGSTIDASGSNAGATLSFTHSTPNINLFDTGGTRTINLIGTNTGNNIFAIQVTDQATNQTSLRKAGTGTWYLTNNNNTYTGETIFAGGILNVASVSDYGVPSAIGARTFAQENNTVTGISLHFQGGTLQYTGSTPQSTNRQIRVLNGVNGSTIDASGSNAGATLSFTHTGANINLFDTGGTRTINLVGTNTGPNLFANAMTDQATNPTSLRKAGAGTWVISGASTYTGGTVVAGGALRIANTSGSATGTGNVTVQNGGTLEGAGSIAGNVIVQSGGAISPGAGGDTIGTLNIGGSIDLQAGSRSKSDIDGPSADLVRVSGNITIADGLVIPDGQVNGTPGVIYVVANNLGANPVSGAFATLPQNPAGTPFVFDGRNAIIFYNYNADTNQLFTGNDIAIAFNTAPTLGAPATAAVMVNEGQPATNSGTFFDVDSSDVVTITASVGTVTQSDPRDGTWNWSLPTVDGPAGPFTVTITATDTFGATATTTFTYSVLNVPPALTISGPSSVAEGSTYTLSLAAVDPGDDTLIAWDINWGDGSPIQTVPGNATSVTHVYADGPAAFNISATASDEDGGPYISNTLPVTITNASPTPVLEDVEVQNQPVSDFDDLTVVPGLPITFVVSTTDPAADSVDAPFSFTLDWGDGSTPSTGETTAEGELLSLTHVYTTYGQFTPTLTVVDNDLGVGVLDLPTVTSAPIIEIDGTVYVGGENRSDRIIVAAGGTIIRMNSALLPPQSVSDRVVVFGNGGNDTITVSGSGIPVEFYGGAGNDYLAGGTSNDLLDGGDGNDRILGGNGDDVLLGGGGSDRLSGGNGNDYAHGDYTVDAIFGEFVYFESLDREIPVMLGDQPGRDSLYGDNGDDVLEGGPENNRLYGGGGNDILIGGDGNDYLDGGNHDDLLIGGVGADSIYGRSGRDVLIGESGLDTLYGGTGSDLLYGGSVLEGVELNELVEIWMLWRDFDSEGAADMLEGIAEDDQIADLLHGERDDDWYLLFAEFATGGKDRLRLTSEARSPNVSRELS